MGPHLTDGTRLPYGDVAGARGLPGAGVVLPYAEVVSYAKLSEIDSCQPVGGFQVFHLPIWGIPKRSRWVAEDP